MLAHHPVLTMGYSSGQLTTETKHGRREVSCSPMEALRLIDTLVNEDELIAVGYISYEGSLEMQEIEAAYSLPCPTLEFRLYESVFEYDHAQQMIRQIGHPSELLDSAREESRTPPKSPASGPTISSALKRSEYLRAVARIKEHIHEGDIYQANFTTRFDVQSLESPFEVYLRLRSLSPSPYAAFLDCGAMQILSSSPERMLLRVGDRITTSPIKGTIAAGESEIENEANRRSLIASEKDRAELLMIVDLERNDLGRIAEVGSVTVDSLFRTEQYRSLIHLVSDISATVGSEPSIADVLQALLPGGSITGAPKLRAIEILQQLEPVPRGIYTGCIGYIMSGRADFNIAIRTMVHQNGIYQIHAGGGIVADSSPEAEYEEMLLKATNMFRAVGLTEDQIACLHR